MKRLALLLLSLALFCSGCEHDKEPRSADAPANSSGSSGSAATTASGLIGTWELSGGGTTWYMHFRKDGSWSITDDRAGTKEQVHGSYTADDSSFKGDMTNPGVGTGSISGYYNGRSLALAFHQDWTTPPKSVSYTGRKL